MANRAIPVRPVRVKLIEQAKLLELATTAPYIVTDEAGKILWRSTSAESLKMRPTSGGILLNGHLLSEPSVNVKLTTFGTINLADRKYRGWFRLVKNRSGASLMVVNHVPLEQYVASVIGSELPSYFHPEAFRAQAVAARTYVLHRMLNTNRPDWDVSDTAASQVYSGLSTETPQALRAQRSTFGEVLLYGPPGREEIICTFYSSTCGGGTRPVWELKKGFEHIEPLAGVQVDQCQESPRYRWEKRVFSKTKLLATLATKDPKLKRLGSLTRVDIASRTPQGRAKEIVLLGQRSSKATILAEDFRYTLKLPSTWFDIEDHGSKVWFTKGRGWGHGMGMCQFGANGMARHGYRYEEILSKYFPGSKLERCY